MNNDAQAKKIKSDQENPFLNLIFNIFLPLIILNKGTEPLGPGIALVTALFFPIAFGAYDLLTRKKTNFFSILGLLNIGLTGGFALSGLTGTWFAIKEAAFPLLIGIFVLASAFGKKPFIKTLFLNPQIINVNLLDSKISTEELKTQFEILLKSNTILLSISFALSALLNFFLAVYIFTPIDPLLEETARSSILNQQIAEMTKWSFLVILLPSMIFLMIIFAHLFRGLKKLTGLTIEEIMPKN